MSEQIDYEPTAIIGATLNVEIQEYATLDSAMEDCDDPAARHVIIDLASLGVLDGWTFDSVIEQDESRITLLLVPEDLEDDGLMLEVDP